MKSSVNAPLTLDSILTRAATTQEEEGVKSFLGKPHIIQNGSFNQTDVVSTFPGLNVPGDIVAAPIYANKLSGYYGFRATTVFTLVVNASRFQQGRYMLTFCSTAGAVTSGGVNDWVSSHSNTLIQRTQLPKVEIDLNCDTQAQLKIPFVSGFNIFPFQTSSVASLYNIGVIRLYPYVAISSSAGTSSADYTLYAHFEDIELVGPAQPQMGKKTVSYSEKEQKHPATGPISSFLVKTTEAFNIWADVPLIGAYATTASWLSDALGRTASIFGWSKPLLLDAPCRMMIQPALYANNTDNLDTAIQLAWTSKNEVGVFPGFSGTAIDEMEFAHLASMPVYNRTIAWSNQARGANLLELGVGPPPPGTRTGVSTTIFDYSPLSFLGSNYFTQWRGSLVYTFKFVKTEFHSGRLSISFMPAHATATTPSTAASQTDYVQREIIDIRETNTVKLTVPYMSWQPWMRTGQTTGALVVNVIDTLIAPATVNSTISIILEISAGPDFEVATPSIHPNLSPIFGVVPQMEEPRNDCALVEKTIGSSTLTNDNYASASCSIGERINNFRSLVKAVFWMNVNSATAATPFPTGWNAVITWPYYFDASFDTATIANQSPTFTPDLLGCLTSWYGLSRGGVRYRFVYSLGTETNTANALVVTTSTNSFFNGTRSAFGAFKANSFDPINSASAALANVDRNGLVEIQFPQYSDTHSRINANALLPPNTNVPASQPGYSGINATTYQKGATNTALLVGRSAADDFNLGQFISIPPLCALTTNTGTGGYTF
jgi:hypothetical protein